MLNIGQKIKEVAKSKKISQVELAKMIHTSKQNINNIFKRDSIDTKTLSKFCEVLEYDFYSLFNSKINKDVEKVLHENKKMKDKIETLHKEISYLKEINLLLKTKNR